MCHNANGISFLLDQSSSKILMKQLNESNKNRAAITIYNTPFFSPLDPSVSHRYSGIGGSVSMNENIKWHAINGKQVQFIMLFLSSGLSSCMFKPEWDRAPSIK